MSNLRAFLFNPVSRVIVLSLAVWLLAFATAAQRHDANFIFLVASGFLCDPSDSSNCPATAKATQGDSYEMSGAGTFEAQTKSVKAAGTFTHKSPNGDLYEAGVWLATELVSFDSYGAAPGALTHQALAFGPARFGGPKHLQIPPGPIPTGGLAVFRIHLFPMSGPSKTAVLQVNCALGEVPRGRSVEGIRLALEKNGNEFSEEAGGA